MDEVKYNGSFDIATGRNRKETHWRNKEILWSDFLDKISTTHRTAETLTQYMAEKKTRQDEIKDVGGFVGGYINGGRRKNGNITHRQLITLDIDFSDGHIWQDYKVLYDNAAAVYSTHKHCPESPRLRLILPLDRPVSTDEYTAISRKIAGDLGINFFDDTTFEPARLMYWPSTSKDAEYVFEYLDGPFLNADEVLSTYRNWKDASEWPVSDRQGEVIKREIKKQGDPLDKPGIIGAFCREYDIHEAIDTFLSDIYEPCAEPDRYTYINGSTAAGLVVYEDKYSYSHHGTDPTSGKLCNAFDLVRLHLFGLQDETIPNPDTPVNKLPSYVAMLEHVSKDGAVRKRLGTERLEGTRADFAEGYQSEESPNMDWLEDMDTDKKGNYRNTIDNIILIMENDVNLKNKFALNRFENRETLLSSPPWRTITPQTKYMTDRDDSSIRHYLEKFYNITGISKIYDALLSTFENNSFHPVRDYLNSLTWDGVQRVERLFIDYLGAEESDYIKAVTRKTLVAAVARVFNPGCKFDYVLVLIGKQGIGKSTIIKLLGRDWYSDSFCGVQGKEAFEQLQGVWILEIAELAGIKKAEAESIKHFISKQADAYRVAYGKRSEVFPRQCVFIGTTNTKDFLSDHTGNRRFWPVNTLVKPRSKSVFTIGDFEINQLWAEALTLYKAGEKLYLSSELEEIAAAKQEESRETDDRTGIIAAYLDTLVPEAWPQMDLHERRAFLTGDVLQPKGEILRDHISIVEIWVELFGRAQSEMNNYLTKPLHNIMRSLPGWEQEKSKRNIAGYGMQVRYRRKSSAHDRKITNAVNSGQL